MDHQGILSTLAFPATRYILWDDTPRGQTQILQLTAIRPLALTVPGRTLSLAEKHAKRSNRPSFSGFLIGHPSVSPEDNSLVIAIDRFDPGRQPKDHGSQSEKQPTAIVPGDFVIPFKIWREPGDRQSSLVFTGFQYKEAIQQLHDHCCRSSPLTVSDTFIIHCSCSAMATASNSLKIHGTVILMPLWLKL
jgi:SCL-interrupting locus protein